MGPSLPQVFLSEVLGTATLVLLGCGVVANALLAKTKGFAGGPLFINVGWGTAVFAGVYVAYASGAHLNPAVTIGLLVSGNEYTTGIDATVVNTVVYLAAEMVGGVLGAAVVWLAYKQHFDATEDGPTKLGVFSTGPEIRSYGWNVLTEVVGTFVLVLLILVFGNTPAELGPLPVAVVVLAIGVSLGGPTGYAINPARDLGPRIAHALLPIRAKGSSDWRYAWVPVVGPLIGGALAGLVFWGLPPAPS